MTGSRLPAWLPTSRVAVGVLTFAGAALALGIELDWLIAAEGGPRKVAALCITLGLLAMLTPDSRVAAGSRIVGFAAIAVGFPAMTLTFIREPTRSTLARVAGVDAIRTAVSVSEAGFATADTAVLIGAREANVAYAAGSLAASVGGPVLLTHDMSIPRVTAKELQRLGVTHAVIVGDAPSAHIERRLQWLDIAVTRIAGGRVAAAAAVATRVASPSMVVLVDDAPGDAALAGNAITSGASVVWATPDGVPLETAAAILAQRPTRVVVHAPTTAIRDDLQRLGVEIAPTLPVDHGRSSSVWMAAAEAPIDVAIASAATAALGADLLIVTDDSATGGVVLRQSLSRYDEVVVVGGTASLSDETVSAL